MEREEISTLYQVCKKAKSRGKMTGAQIKKLCDFFGDRFLNAWETLKEGRVKKYLFKPSGRVVWVVVGKKRDYLLFPAAEFCSCDDFYFRIMDKEAHLCYHLIAQKIAENLKWHDVIEEHDELHDTLMKEWSEVIP